MYIWVTFWATFSPTHLVTLTAFHQRYSFEIVKIVNFFLTLCRRGLPSGIVSACEATGREIKSHQGGSFYLRKKILSTGISETDTSILAT
jgi:hypothetical protein